MKKQLIAILIAGLAATTVFANGDTQNTNNQTAPSMQAQPQTSDTNNNQNAPNGNGTSGQDQQDTSSAAQQD